MAIKDYFSRKKLVKELKPVMTYFARAATQVTEQFKSETSTKEDVLMKDIGEPHPVDFKELERWYCDDSFAFGAINHIAKHVVGPGFFVKSKDARIEELANQFLKDNNFQTLLHDWVLKALVTGNGFLELAGPADKAPVEMKLINSSTMFVKRDSKGVVKEYNQWRGFGTKAQAFTPEEVAHLKLNVKGDDAYGQGHLRPFLFALKKKSCMINDMGVLMKRKANAPYHVVMGDKEKNIIPSQSDLDNMKASLEHLNNDHEWVTSPHVEIKALDFGALGDKFVSPVDILNEELYFGSQVPPLIMGSTNVSQGLSKGDVSLESFQFMIRSIQEIVEKEIEDKILKRVILGTDGEPLDADVEFEWGQPTPEEKREEVDMLIKLLGASGGGGGGAFGLPSPPKLSPDFVRQVEDRLRELLEFEGDAPERDEEEAEPQPRAPPAGLKRPNKDEKEPETGKEKPKEAWNEYHRCICEAKEDFDNMTLKEFIGFDYAGYVEDIKKFIKSKEFEQRTFKGFRFVPGTNQELWEEQIISYAMKDNLTKAQINKLRDVLSDQFDKGGSMREIAADIRDKVKPKDLTVKVPAVFDDKGNLLRKEHEKLVSSEARAINLARTETIRASNQGALNNYKEHGIEKVKWIASVGERTCPYCDGQNGQILSLADAQERIPAHMMCRCAWSPVVELD